ncbi:MAG TPA: O-antigen ligase family protein [Acidimicrobiales bacterium]|nr:O-antigen ligase family protein [Acidimicrobiales bacterium]
MSGVHKLAHFFAHPTPAGLAILAGLLILLPAIAYLGLRLAPGLLVCVGLGLEIFSGNWRYMHVPLPLDRLMLLAGLLSLILGGRRAMADRAFVLRPVHVLLLVVAAWATMSAIGAGTLAGHNGFYALLDRLGLVPFLGFTLAPLLFGDARRRNMLIVTMVVVGGYLSVTAIMEGTGLLRYVEPSYIRNPHLGIHYGRSRGPFLEAEADGLAMVMCAVAASIGVTTWKGRKARVAAAGVVLTCAVGAIFTLTRSIWIGGALALIVGVVAHPRTRRWSPLFVLGAAALAVSVVFAVPSLHTKARDRLESASPVWDRENTDLAALRAAEAHPLLGIGWETFQTKGPSYLREGNYPLTGAGLEVHNVLLSHAAELGLPGAILWLLALLAAVGGAVFRRSRPEMLPWRVGLLCIAVPFLVVANVSPLSYPFPNFVLWLWAGVTATPYLSRPFLPRRLPSGWGHPEDVPVDPVEQIPAEHLVEFASEQLHR